MCLLKKKFLILFINIFTLIFGNNFNYCSKALCKSDRVHIACGNNGATRPACAKFSQVLDLTPEIKANITKMHNEYRSKLALGKVPLYSAASRMATMQWNDELAFLAELNVRTCTGTHDSCRNTFRFPHSGQNIARRSTHYSNITMDQLKYNIYHGIDRWFNEHEICPRDGSILFTNAKQVCGHFTVMISERNNYLGCAVIHMKNDKTVFTCNYAYNNMKNQKLYSPGKPSSECKSGCNPKYPGLCSINEMY